jgi:hypothetical protein
MVLRWGKNRRSGIGKKRGVPGGCDTMFVVNFAKRGWEPRRWRFRRGPRGNNDPACRVFKIFDTSCMVAVLPYGLLREVRPHSYLCLVKNRSNGKIKDEQLTCFMFYLTTFYVCGLRHAIYYRTVLLI